MSKLLNLLRECNDRLVDEILGIATNSTNKGECFDLVNVISEHELYVGDPDSEWLVARCYSVRELKEFLRNYGRDDQ